MTAGGERIRLFVALELPQAVRAALVDWRASFVDGLRGPRLRLVRAEDLHVTLCFLGWRAAGDVEPVLAACSVVEGVGVAPLRLGRAIWLPPRRPRVLAVELADDAGRLERVQSVLSSALDAGGWYVPERRRFLAHVTVARVSSGGRASGRASAEAEAEAEAGSSPPSLAFDGSRVALFRSRLSPAGARYEALGTVALGDG